MRKLLYLMLLLPFLAVSQENESFLLNMSDGTFFEVVYKRRKTQTIVYNRYKEHLGAKLVV